MLLASVRTVYWSTMAWVLAMNACGRSPVGLVGEVLLTVNVPDRHHYKHDQGPDQRQRDPGPLDPVQWLIPPDGLGRGLNGSHYFTSFIFVVRVQGEWSQVP